MCPFCRSGIDAETGDRIKSRSSRSKSTCELLLLATLLRASVSESTPGAVLLGERGLEALVDFDLIAGDELVSFVGHADDGLKFLEHGVGHSFAEGGSSVRGDAVVAVVGDAYGDVDQFFGERIESAWAHDLLETFPGAFEQGGIVRDGLPEIVDPVDFARGHDVVVNGADFRRSVLVFDQSECGHEGLPKYLLARLPRR